MEVIPIPPRDQRHPVRNLRTRTFFILDHCLDETILKDALTRLIRDHWRKLGARLVERPKDGLLEYHLPRSFGEKYALFNWSSQEYDHSIEKVTSLPKATPPDMGVRLLPHLSSVEKWFRPSDWPFEQKDDPPDTPLLYIHLALFTDATVIAVSCPHVLADQFGMSNIMKAWLDETRGEAPPPLVGVNEDILANGKSYADYPVEEVVRKGRIRVRGKLDYPLVLAGIIPEIVVHQKEVAHTLFLPLPVVDKLRKMHTEALTDKYGKDAALSNGDIVTAICFKLSLIHNKKSRMIALSQTINLRGRIPQLNGDRYAFIHNSLSYATARFRFDPSTSLGEVAYQNRQAILQAVDPKDIEITIAVLSEMARLKQPMIICEPFEKFYHVTNWSSAWNGLDFSASVKKQEQEANVHPTVKLLVLGESKERKAPGRFSTPILCKTEEGYWCNFCVPERTDKLIKEYLIKDPKLENL